MKKILNICTQLSLIAIMLFLANNATAQNAAVSFNGSTHYFLLPSGTTSAFNFGSTRFSVEAWVRPNSFTGSGNIENTIVANDDWSGANAFGFALRTGGNRRVEFVYGSGTTWNSVTTAINTLTANQWTHVAVTKNAGTVTIYINGVQAATQTFTLSSISSSTKSVRIGENGNLDNRRFNGVIEDLKFWTVARTPSEINTDMQETCPIYPSNLLAYFKMNEKGSAVTLTCANNVNYNANLSAGTFASVASNLPLTTCYFADTVVQHICAGNTFTYNGIAQSSSGYYSDTFYYNNSMDTVHWVQLVVNALPIVSLSATKLHLCNGDSTIFSATGASTYTLSPLGQLNTPLTISSVAQTFTVTGSDANGCTASSSVTINKITQSLSMAASANHICTGGSTTITASASGGFVTWSPFFANGASASPSVTTTYTATLTDMNGYCSITDSITITVGNPASPVLANTQLCGQSAHTLTVTNPSTVYWYENATDEYSIHVGSSYSKNFSTIENYYIQNVIPTNTATFAAASTGTLTTSTSAILFPLTANTDLRITGFEENLAVGTQTVTVYYRADNYVTTGTGASSAGWISLGSIPINVTTAGLHPINLPGTLRLSAGQTYSFYIYSNVTRSVKVATSGTAGNAQQTTTDFILRLGNSSGSLFGTTSTGVRRFEGKIIYTKGCESARVPYTIQVAPIPNLSITHNALEGDNGSVNICNGNNITLNASGADAHIWSHAVGNNIAFVPTASNIYTVTGTNAGYCSTTSAIEINVANNTPPVISAYTFCAAGTQTLSIGNNNTRWYDSANALVSIGNSQTITPNITSSKTFYASNFEPYKTDILGTTTFANSSNSRLYFIVDALKDVRINALKAIITGSGTQTVEIYYRPGNYYSFTGYATLSTWEKLGSYSITGNPILTNINLQKTVDITAGTSGSFLIYCSGSGLVNSFSPVTFGAAFTSNDDMQIIAGHSGNNAGYVLAGEIAYQLGCQSIKVPVPVTLISPPNSYTAISNATLTNLQTDTLLNEGFNNLNSFSNDHNDWRRFNTSEQIGIIENWFIPEDTDTTAIDGGVYFSSVGLSADSSKLSNWLLSPVRTFKNGDVINFYTRSLLVAQGYADRLRVYLSNTGDGVNVGTSTTTGSFSKLLLDINPTLDSTGYPLTWTKYTITISGLNAPYTGRIGFQHYNPASTINPQGVWIDVDNILVTRPINAFCNHDSIVLNASIIGGTAPYTLYLSNGNVITNYSGQSDAQFKQLISATSSSIQLVKVTDSVGCPYNANSSITYTIKSIPTIIANASSANLCNGDSVKLYGSGGVTYTWAGTNQLPLNNINFVPTNNTFTVTGKDAYGCSGTSTILLNLNPYASTNAISLSDSVVCQNTAVTISSTFGYTLLYQPSFASYTNATTISNTGAGEDVFVYQKNSAAPNTCPYVTIPYKVNGLPTVTDLFVKAENESFDYPGSNDASVPVDWSQKYDTSLTNYWRFTGSTLICEQTAPNDTIRLLSPVLDIQNGDLIKFKLLDLGVFNSPTIEVRLSTCGNGTSLSCYNTVLATLNPSKITGVLPNNFTEYTYAINTVPTVTTGRIEIRLVSGSSNSWYSITELDDFIYLGKNKLRGCKNYDNAIMPVITNGTAPYTITLNNNLTYSNYNGGDIMVVPNATTTYSITNVVDAAGCAPNLLNSNVQIVTNNVTPVTASYVPTNNCALYITLTSSGPLTRWWEGFNSYTAGIVNIGTTKSKIFRIYGVDDHGCKTTDTALGLVCPKDFNFSAVKKVCNGVNGEISVFVPAGFDYFFNTPTDYYDSVVSFTISPNVGNNPSFGVFNNLPAGTYTITATSALGKTRTKVASILNSTATVIFVENVSSCNNSVSAYHSQSFGNVLWSNGATTNTVKNLSPNTTYTVSIAENDGCIITSTYVLPTVTPVTTNASAIQNLCGSSAIVNLNPSGGFTGGASIKVKVNSNVNYDNIQYVIRNGFNNSVAGKWGITGGADSLVYIAPDTPNVFFTKPPYRVEFSEALPFGSTNGYLDFSILVNGVEVNSGCFKQSNASQTCSTVDNYTYNIPVTLTSTPYGIEWNNGSTTGIGTNNLTAGTYTFTVTDPLDCSTTTVVTVPASTLTFQAFASDDTVCVGSPITLTDNAPVGYTVTWSHGKQTGVPFVPSASIIYTVTATMGNCSATSTVSVTINPKPIITSNNNPIVCTSSMPFALVASPSGGVWTGNYLVGSNVVDMNLFPSGVTNSTYTYTVTDGFGCSASFQKSISKTLINFSAPPASICQNANSFVLNTAFSPALNSNVLTNWGGSSGIFSVGNTYYFNPSLAGVGTHTLLCVGDDGFCSSGAYFTITVLPAPTISATVPTICNAAPINIALTTSGGTGLTTTSPSPNNLSAGSYTFTATDAVGCSATTIANIFPPQFALIFTATTITNASCASSTNGAVTVGVSGSNNPTYAITPNLGTANGSATSITYTNLPVGTYTITVTNANGCSANTVITINANTINLLFSSQISPSICAGTLFNNVAQFPLQLSAGSSFANASFTATIDGTVFTNNFNSSGAYSFNLSSNAVGVHTVAVTHAASCALSIPVSFTYTIHPNPTISATVPTICNAAPINIALTTSGGTGLITTSPSPNNLSAGSYTFTATDAVGCKATTVATIIPPQLPLIFTATTITNAGCTNNGAVTIGLSGGNNTTYAILPNLGTANGSATNITYTNLPSGTYTITATNANGCSATSSIIINNITAISFVTPIITNATCNLSNGALSVWANGGAGAKAYTIAPNIGVSNPIGGTFTNLAAGTYTVTASDINGCTKTIAYTITAITAITLPVPNFTSPLCNGKNTGSITASAIGTAPFSYSSTPLLTQITAGLFTNVAAGTYTILATDANGCTSTNTIIVTQPMAIVLSAPALTQPTCKDAQNGSLSITANGGLAPYVYTLNPNIGIQPVPGTFGSLASGIYMVRAIDANGCSSSRIVPLPQPAVLRFTGITNRTNVSCNGGNSGSVTVLTSGGVGSRTLSIMPSANIASPTSFSLMIAATYTIQVSDANSCTKTTTVIIAQPSALVWNSVVAIGSTPSASGNIVVSASGGVGTKLYALTPTYPTATISGTYSGLASGTYTATATDANACNISTTIIIMLNVNMSHTPHNVIPQNLDSVSDSIASMTHHSTVNSNGESISSSMPLSGKINNALDELTWQVDYSKDITTYDIQELQNGIYKTIASLTNDLNKQIFSFTNSQYKTSIYRVSAIANNGSKTFSNTISLQRNELNAIVMYPNPASNEIHLDIFSANNSNATVKIFDITGKLVRQVETELEKGTNSTTLDISTLASGVYTVKVSDGKGWNEVLQLHK